MSTIDDRLDALTDDEWALTDRLGAALESAGPAGLTPSQAARKARCSTAEAGQLLPLMAAARLALTSGNGAWTHFHAYDRRRDPTLARTWRAR